MRYESVRNAIEALKQRDSTFELFGARLHTTHYEGSVSITQFDLTNGLSASVRGYGPGNAASLKLSVQLSC